MDRNFWNQLIKPIWALAPMANVTDAAFRQMFARYGKPNVLWTEFVSVEGLLSSGRERLLIDLWYAENEHPIVAQIFGARPDQFEQAASLIESLGFDGIDINMGCPEKSVEKQGGGAALIMNPELAVEIIRATKHGARGLPVSVKTRLGYQTSEIKTWLAALLEEDLATLIVHLRTRNEMSDVPAHWELASEIVVLRNHLAPQTKLLGNGDVVTLADARAKVIGTGIDGVMIGRGAFGQPGFFSEKNLSVSERFAQLIEHTELFEKLYIRDFEKKGRRPLKNFEIMRKHFKAYTAGFKGAKDLRVHLMEAGSATDVRLLVKEFIRTMKYDGLK